MADRSKIEWTDATWTPIRAELETIVDGDQPGSRKGWHCEHVSEGCRNCYAESINRRLGTLLDYKPGYVRSGAVEIILEEQLLRQPLRWKRPRLIFVCSMTDLFADFVPDEFIDRMFAIMALCPQHTFQVLTKRPARMRAYMESASLERWARACVPGTLPISQNEVERRLGLLPKFSYDQATPAMPLPNVWLGTSVEDQAAADARIPELLATPAAVRFLSCEPLLGAVDLTALPTEWRSAAIDALRGDAWSPLGSGQRMWLRTSDQPPGPRLDWVIVGGESGRDARPMHPDWARQLRDQCAAAGVPFTFKQWGEFAFSPIVPAVDDLDEVEHLSCIDNEGRSWALSKAAGGEWLALPPGAQMWRAISDLRPDLLAWKRVGKKRAGRLLDDVQHDGRPA